MAVSGIIAPSSSARRRRAGPRDARGTRASDCICTRYTRPSRLKSFTYSAPNVLCSVTFTSSELDAEQLRLLEVDVDVARAAPAPSTSCRRRASSGRCAAAATSACVACSSADVVVRCATARSLRSRRCSTCPRSAGGATREDERVLDRRAGAEQRAGHGVRGQLADCVRSRPVLEQDEAHAGVAALAVRQHVEARERVMLSSNAGMRERASVELLERGLACAAATPPAAAPRSR